MEKIDFEYDTYTIRVKITKEEKYLKDVIKLKDKFIEFFQTIQKDPLQENVFSLERLGKKFNTHIKPLIEDIYNNKGQFISEDDFKKFNFNTLAGIIVETFRDAMDYHYDYDYDLRFINPFNRANFYLLLHKVNEQIEYKKYIDSNSLKRVIEVFYMKEFNELATTYENMPRDFYINTSKGDVLIAKHEDFCWGNNIELSDCSEICRNEFDKVDILLEENAEVLYEYDRNFEQFYHYIQANYLKENGMELYKANRIYIVQFTLFLSYNYKYSYEIEKFNKQEDVLE